MEERCGWEAGGCVREREVGEEGRRVENLGGSRVLMEELLDTVNEEWVS